MEASTSEQQPQATISAEALDALYRDLGQKTHAIYERNVQIAKMDTHIATITAALTTAQEQLRQLYEQFAPEGAPPLDPPAVASPLPMKTRRNESG